MLFIQDINYKSYRRKIFSHNDNNIVIIVLIKKSIKEWYFSYTIAVLLSYRLISTHYNIGVHDND